jgi:hypothetical protein
MRRRKLVIIPVELTTSNTNRIITEELETMAEEFTRGLVIINTAEFTVLLR